MAWSQKAALDKVGAGRPASLVRDLFGYRLGSLPPGVAGEPTAISLLWWATLNPRMSFNINAILVGSESFTTSMLQEVDVAIHRLREIYRAVGVGVKWVLPYVIPVKDAEGLDVMTSEDELDDLLEGWAVDNTAIDLYFPAAWLIPGLLGRSAVDGPCPGEKEKDKKKGSVTGLTGPATSSRTSAHEVGHYLSLSHRNDDSDNLMCQTKFADSPTWQQVSLDKDQVEDVRQHCMVLKLWVP